MNVRHIEKRPYYKLMKSDIEGLSPNDYLQISTDQDHSQYVVKVSSVIDRYEKGIGAPNGKPSIHWNSDLMGVSASEGIPLWMKEQAINKIPLYKEKQSWIFQGNPDRFNMDAYLVKEHEKISWRVSKHKKEIRIGDEVFIWRAQGSKSQATPGIVARGTITSEVWSGLDETNASQFWKTEEDTSTVSDRISLELHEINRDTGMLKKETIKNHPPLEGLNIIKNPRGTTFRLTYDEADAINTLWKPSLNWEIISSQLGNESPRIKLTSVRAFERSRAIIEATKKRANYLCEVEGCSQSLFKKTDGEIYTEVHHLIRLSDGGPDTLENTVCLCPHHHREIHYGKKLKALTEELIEMRKL